MTEEFHVPGQREGGCHKLEFPHTSLVVISYPALPELGGEG